MLNIIDTTIKIPNLTKSLSLIHITDLHLTRADERDNEYVNQLGLDRKIYFPNTEIIFDELKQYIINNRPDCTVLTGDIIDFPSELLLIYCFFKINTIPLKRCHYYGTSKFIYD